MIPLNNVNEQEVIYGHLKIHERHYVYQGTISYMFTRSLIIQAAGCIFIAIYFC